VLAEMEGGKRSVEKSTWVMKYAESSNACALLSHRKESVVKLDTGMDSPG
jgi:hypothetical protein